MMESSSFQPSVRRTTMKMASVSVVSVFLLCCSAVASQVCNKYVATGQNFDVPLGYTPKPTDGWKWKLNTKTIIYMKAGKVVTKDGGETHANGSLKLTNLKKEQEGLYTSEVYDNEGRKLATKETKLCIVDPVKKPKATATCQDEKVKFVCDLSQQPKGVKYEWFQNGAKMKKNENPLNVEATEIKYDNFFCKVFNEATSETSEPVTHPCPKTGIPGLPDELWGINIWVYVGGGGGIVILLIIIVIVCCVRTKRTRKLRLKDEEELRLEWTNTNHHPNHPPLPDHPPPHHPNRHHHHHHHHQHQQQQEQQQAPGNTGPRQSRSKQSRQPRARAPEPNGQPQPSPRRTGQTQKPASDADDEQPPPLPQPRKKGPKTQLD
ncbi:T-cell surface antigen CD2 [Poecilia reticulata]|uniref:CD2 molecule n=1 Tax=Poecilia reticulata TaxID=8081 RepID=A0A3P9P873_POERE|nr:PREDICTED: T-cell surface antigen CD2 [Poecilia reticulata]